MSVLMDRENAMARGWSHVHSDAPTLAAQTVELQAFRKKIGAPPSAFQSQSSWLHLDVKQGPRLRALADPAVRVFETSSELVIHLRDHVIRNTPANRAAEQAASSAADGQRP